MSGKAPAHVDPNYVSYNPEPVIYADLNNCRGMRYELRVKAKNKDGQVTSDTKGLHVRNATKVTLCLSAAINFNGFNKCPDKEGKNESQLTQEYLQKAFSKNFEIIRQAHLKDYQQYFNRVTFSLNNNPVVNLPTVERLMRYADGTADPTLEALYFQYGRYLLISSGRAAYPPICKASGTRICARPGAVILPLTLTCR